MLRPLTLDEIAKATGGETSPVRLTSPPRPLSAAERGSEEGRSGAAALPGGTQ